MGSLFRRWKNQLRCSKRKRHPSIIAENEFKTVHTTLDKLHQDNRILTDRFDKLEERCQQWIADEQVFFLRRIEQLENENNRLQQNHRIYQIQSEKCIRSVTDLIIKTLFTQEELRKQCSDLHDAIDTIQLKKTTLQDESLTRSTRSISCQFTSNPSADVECNNRYTGNDQHDWLHQQLVIVEEQDRHDQSELHITESQSTVYSPTLAANAIKYKSNAPSTGLTNELYYASHKPDGDSEKTPPALARNKRRSPHADGVLSSTSTIPVRRPISSPIRSATYVLQQHHRINNNINTNKRRSSPVHPINNNNNNKQQSSTTTPMTFNKNRLVQQQNQQHTRTYSNHERLPPPSNIDSSTTHQFVSRAHITLTPRRTSPIVRSVPTKTPVSRPSRVPTTIVRSPRVPAAAAPPPSIPIHLRSPRIPIRPPVVQPSTQAKSPRARYPLPKSPEPLRSVGATLTRPRPAHIVVNKSKMGTPHTTTNSVKSVIVQQPASTPRVSDLDTLMSAQRVDTTVPAITIQHPANTSIVPSSPKITNIRRSLFSTDAVRLVRPVRSQELKLFSCHLTPDLSISGNPDVSISTLTPPSRPTTTDELIDDQETITSEEKSMDNHSRSSSFVSGLMRDLSADSLNEHHHIQRLLQCNASNTVTNNYSEVTSLSNDDNDPTDDPSSPVITSWSRIRSSCESNISQIAPLYTQTSASPALYNGPVRQQDIQMAGDGRYFLLIDDNPSSQNSSLNQSPQPSSSLPKATPPSILIERKPARRLVFPTRLGRIVFYRRIVSDSDIYQKLCSKENEIRHNVYHLDTIRDYSMEFYMLTTYGTDSQLRAWPDSNDGTVMNTCYFDDSRYQPDDDEDDELHVHDEETTTTSSSEDVIQEEDEEMHRLNADEELDWYSELESFNLSPTNPEWKQDNGSSCSSEDHVEDLLRAEQFSVSSLTTTTSADSSSSVGCIISASWPTTTNGTTRLHSSHSSQSLCTQPPLIVDEKSSTILQEILTYPWQNPMNHMIQPESGIQSNIESDNGTISSSVVTDEFRPDFYYLCPLKTTNSFPKTDERIGQHLSHDV